MKSNLQVVDYKTCPICGFRLVRVEPPIDRKHRYPVENCPICGMRRDEEGYMPGKKMSRGERQAAFEAWLAIHGLNLEILRDRYRLRPENFFDDNE